MKVFVTNIGRNGDNLYDVVFGENQRDPIVMNYEDIEDLFNKELAHIIWGLYEYDSVEIEVKNIGELIGFATKEGK